MSAARSNDRSRCRSAPLVPRSVGAVARMSSRSASGNGIVDDAADRDGLRRDHLAAGALRLFALLQVQRQPTPVRREPIQRSPVAPDRALPGAALARRRRRWRRRRSPPLREHGVGARRQRGTRPVPNEALAIPEGSGCSCPRRCRRRGPTWRASSRGPSPSALGGTAPLPWRGGSPRTNGRRSRARSVGRGSWRRRRSAAPRTPPAVSGPS